MAFVPSTVNLTTEECVCVACCSSFQNSQIVTLLCYPDDAVSDHTWHNVITGHGTETEVINISKIQQCRGKQRSDRGGENSKGLRKETCIGVVKMYLFVNIVAIFLRIFFLLEHKKMP